MEFVVKVDYCGDVYVNGQFVSQLCFDEDAVGYAIAEWLKHPEESGEDNREDALIDYKRYCPMCGKKTHMTLSEDEYSDVVEYSEGITGIYIQDALPDFTPAEREYVKSGYCPTCMNLLFGNAKANHPWNFEE